MKKKNKKQKGGNNLNKNDFINDNNYKEYFENKNIQWINKLNEIKLYINQNNKRPSAGDKDIYTKSLGDWIGTQLKNYNKNYNCIVNNEENKKVWVKFITDYQVYFPNNQPSKKINNY